MYQREDWGEYIEGDITSERDFQSAVIAAAIEEDPDHRDLLIAIRDHGPDTLLLMAGRVGPSCAEETVAVIVEQPFSRVLADMIRYGVAMVAIGPETPGNREARNRLSPANALYKIALK